MIWFLVVFLHGTNCPGKCEPAPSITIQMPSQEVCMTVKDMNTKDLGTSIPIECWAKPK